MRRFGTPTQVLLSGHLVAATSLHDGNATIDRNHLTGGDGRLVGGEIERHVGRITSGGKWTPLKLTVIISLPREYYCSQREIALQKRFVTELLS